MRKIDWKPDLIAAIDSARTEVFAWGTMDCATFAADCVQAMTTIDPMAGLRGTYHTALEAKAVVNSAGFADSVEMVASMFDEIEPGMAQTGDIVSVASDDPDWDALGIISGPRIMVMAPDGLGSLPRTDALRAFQVP